MESWRKVWREGIAPHLSTEGLKALEVALETDDPRLIQGATTTPPPLQCVQDWEVEAACALGYPGVVDNGGFHVNDDGSTNEHPCSVAEAEEQFARICYECDLEMGEPASVRWFLNWFDETPRDEMRKLFLEEVRKILRNRRIGELSNGAVDVDVYPIPGVDE